MVIVVPARVELPEEHPLAAPVGEFWSIWPTPGAGRTRYAATGGDLAAFAAAHTGGVGEITVAVFSDWLASLYSR